MSEPSVFTRILRGEIPSEIIAETDNAFVIRDIAPQAPVHLLVIPKTEDYRDVVELSAGDPALLAELVGLAGTVAAEHADGDFRLVFNTGARAGQTVFHVHAHVLAGELSESSLGG
jgi:histidine triad (HIT) family protein